MILSIQFIFREAQVQSISTRNIDAAASAPKRTLQCMMKPTRRQIVAFTVHFVTFLGTVFAIYRASINGLQISEVWLFVAFYCLTMTGLVVGYHRLFTHLSYKTSTPMRVMLAILGSMTVQGPILTWVADHLRHHALSDVEGDLHSPRLHGTTLSGRIRGFWHSHIGWMFTMTETPWNRHVLNLLSEHPIYWVHRNYWWWVALSLLLPALAGWAIIGGAQGLLSGLLWGGLVRIFVLNQVILAVGSICHMFGGRPFAERTKDYSANNWWIACVSFGDGNQNNHHAFPSSAAHGLRWWQPDMAYLIIRLLEKAGLVWDVKVPPSKDIDSAYASHFLQH